MLNVVILLVGHLLPERILVLDRGAIKDTNYKAVHFTGYKNGSRVTESTGNGQANVSLSDLLKNETQFNLSVESCKGERTPFVQAAKLQEELVGTSENSASFVNWLLDQFKTVLGGTSSSDMALQHAYNAIYDMLYPNSHCKKLLLIFKIITGGHLLILNIELNRETLL